MAPLPRTVYYPSLARRMAAVGLDLVIGCPLLLLGFLASQASTGFELARLDAVVRAAVLGLLLFSAYFTFWESSPTRATPGKILLDLRVATCKDAPLSPADAMGRFWLRVLTVLTCNAGLWFAWRDERGRALHDRWTGSTVVAHHVTTGDLRGFARLRVPQWRDAGTALGASFLAYALVASAIPERLQQLRWADEFSVVLEELNPVLSTGELIPDGKTWSSGLREAGEAAQAHGIALDTQGQGLRVVLRARAAADAEQAPKIMLARHDLTDGTLLWSCQTQGLNFYAVPRSCRELQYAFESGAGDGAALLRAAHGSP